MDIIEQMKNSQFRRIKLIEKDGTVTTGYVDVYEDRSKNEEDEACILYQCDGGPSLVIFKHDIQSIEII